MSAMMLKKKRYINTGFSVEIEVSPHCSYDDFVLKAALAAGLKFNEVQDKVILLKAKSGCRIANDHTTLRNGLKESWTIGGYLSRIRKGPETIKFGVGIITSEKQVHC